MKVLLDEDTPAPLAPHLAGHDVKTVPQMGWAGAKNGSLLSLIASSGFEAFLTCDRNLEYQQNLSARPFAVIVIRTPNKRMETLLPLVPQILTLLPIISPGQIAHVESEERPAATSTQI